MHFVQVTALEVNIDDEAINDNRRTLLLNRDLIGAIEIEGGTSYVYPRDSFSITLGERRFAYFQLAPGANIN